MKARSGFVSNSSSTSYILTNHSKGILTLVDFVEENPQLLEEFREGYGYTSDSDLTHEKMLESAADEAIVFQPGQSRECVFGDEQGTLIGRIYDYAMRDGGNSKNFSWKYHDSYR